MDSLFLNDFVKLCQLSGLKTFLLFLLFAKRFMPQKWKTQLYTHTHTQRPDALSAALWVVYQQIPWSKSSPREDNQSLPAVSHFSLPSWSFSSNIHSASSSKADQCCENRNLSCSSWRQQGGEKRDSPEDGSIICDVRDAIYYVLITTKLAIGRVALSSPCGLCRRPAWWRPTFVSCPGAVTHRAIKVQGDVYSNPHVVHTVLRRRWWSQKGGELCPNGTRSSYINCSGVPQRGHHSIKATGWGRPSPKWRAGSHSCGKAALSFQYWFDCLFELAFLKKPFV